METAKEITKFLWPRIIVLKVFLFVTVFIYFSINIIVSLNYATGVAPDVTSVGIGVGLTVGTGVGLAVGIGVGCFVGAGVTLVVRTGVGELVVGVGKVEMMEDDATVELIDGALDTGSVMLDVSKFSDDELSESIWPYSSLLLLVSFIFLLAMIFVAIKNPITPNMATRMTMEAAIIIVFII